MRNKLKELLENDRTIEKISTFCEERYYTGTLHLESDASSLFKSFGNIFEELSEGMKGFDSEHETIDHLVDTIIYSIDTLVQMNVNPTRAILAFLIREDIPYGYDTDHAILVKHDTLSTMVSIFLRGPSKCKPNFDAIKDFYIELILANIRAIEDMGYDARDALIEALLEVSSRKQCPRQIRRGRKPGEKWEKDKDQDKTTMYKAVYTKQEVA